MNRKVLDMVQHLSEFYETLRHLTEMYTQEELREMAEQLEVSVLAKSNVEETPRTMGFAW
jgi:hypothetical protein